RRKRAGQGPTRQPEHAAYRKAYRNAHEKQKQQRAQQSRRRKRASGPDTVAVRNSVLEALREGVPATALYVSSRTEADDRVKESISLAADRGIAMLEAGKQDRDRLTDDAS